MNLLQNVKNAYNVAKLALKGVNFIDSNGNDLYFNRITEIVNTSKLKRYNGTQFQSEAYNQCPQLQAIISKLSDAITKANIIAVDKELKPIKSKAFDNAIKVIENPNIYQTKNQFLRTIETFIKIYGSCFVYKIIPVGFFDISSLIVIPNNCLQIEYKSITNPLANNTKIINRITINIYGSVTILEGENLKLIYEIQDTPVNLTYGKEFQGKSRIDALKNNIENLVGSIESRNHLIVNRGADVVFSPETAKDGVGNSVLTPLDIKNIQENEKKYGLLGNQYSNKFLQFPMKVTKVGMNVRDLGLFDGENADVRAIAQGFGVPTPIIGLPDEAKYNTYKEAKLEFYESTIIPDSQVISQAFDYIFDSEKYGYKFYFDYSHLEIMQKASKEKAESLKIMVEALNSAVIANYITQQQAIELTNDYLK